MNERKEWRCFFCDDVFTTREDAHTHFGEENCVSDVPACVDPLRHDEKARLNELRLARDEAASLRRELEEAEDAQALVESMRSELRLYFGDDCTSVWVAGDRYKNALYRADMAKAREVANDHAD